MLNEWLHRREEEVHTEGLQVQIVNTCYIESSRTTCRHKELNSTSIGFA